MSWVEERERERKRKNAIYSGHLRLCQQPRAAHALRSDQNSAQLRLSLAWLSLCLLLSLCYGGGFLNLYKLYMLPGSALQVCVVVGVVLGGCWVLKVNLVFALDRAQPWPSRTILPSFKKFKMST
jgi:hypothetical protein